MPVDWDDANGFSISRINPPDTSDADLAVLKKMLNKLDNGKDVRSVLKV